MQTSEHLLPVLACILAACSHVPAEPPSAAHLRATEEGTAQPTAQHTAQPTAEHTTAAAPAPSPRAARSGAAAETYSVTVHEVPVNQLLFALARDARINIDIHPGLTGTVTLNAVDQTLPQLLTRIARQVELRFEFDGSDLQVMPDTPRLQTYRIDYVNLSRSVSGTVATTTQIATSATAVDARGGRSGAGNASITQIETASANRFWESLEANIHHLLHDDVRGTPPRRCAATPPGAGGAAPCDADVGGAVMINRETGVLLVRATARQHERLRAFLDQVQGAARRQVLIEATIVEVTLADGYRQGIDWTRLGIPGWSVQPRGGSGSNTLTPTLSYLSGRLDIRLDLLETFGTVKVLSSPRLSVLNNQTAMLKVVEEIVYFLVDASTTEYANSDREKITATTTPQSVSVGMVMSVTPQISEHGDITLNVRPTISSISGFRDDPNPSLGAIPNRVPQIRTREIESVLRLRSGEIAVLGGLMEDRLDRDTGRIPLVGAIPLLGELFTARDNAVRRTELVIFLRPLLIGDPAIGGDFAAYREHLPDDDFFAPGQAGPDARNFPGQPLAPFPAPHPDAR